MCAHLLRKQRHLGHHIPVSWRAWRAYADANWAVFYTTASNWGIFGIKTRVAGWTVMTQSLACLILVCPIYTLYWRCHCNWRALVSFWTSIAWHFVWCCVCPRCTSRRWSIVGAARKDMTTLHIEYIKKNSKGTKESSYNCLLKVFFQEIRPLPNKDFPILVWKLISTWYSIQWCKYLPVTRRARDANTNTNRTVFCRVAWNWGIFNFKTRVATWTIMTHSLTGFILICAINTLYRSYHWTRRAPVSLRTSLTWHFVWCSVCPRWTSNWRCFVKTAKIVKIRY